MTDQDYVLRHSVEIKLRAENDRLRAGLAARNNHNADLMAENDRLRAEVAELQGLVEARLGNMAIGDVVQWQYKARTILARTQKEGE